ncbi:MAG: SDR family NAD(P)-dependent oxidoreductase [Paludibacteraceae bacterium]|nr:SDR family NAD(P)-dependent oxidoreductase [Paludibacteraceae bacterium]MBQ6765377.1 SDR family NAD(P)-dependent oxidoreductase [Paludibacteraceae bacterium]
MLALVTGASNGIGLQYATALARDYHCDLLLVSNQEQELNKVAAGLASQYQVRTVPHFADLSLPSAAEDLHDWCLANGYLVDILINNAGVFFFNPYCETSMKRIDLMLQLHVVTVAKLTRLFAEDMMHRELTDEESRTRICGHKRMRGYILNMSSMSAWMAMPGIQTYNATKAFIYNFSKSLWYEFRPKNVGITVMAPGAVDTALFGLAPNLRKLAVNLTVSIPPEKLVKRALRKMFRNKKADTPGFINWLSTPILKHTPDWLVFLAIKYVGKYQK